jgi:hypothetical protein
VLLVGESAPAGDTFFFAGNSKLFQATKNVFEKLTGKHFSSAESFLRYFCSKGFFLEDLCPSPVNRLPRSERRRLRSESVPSLSLRLQSLQPKALVVVMKGISRPVLLAVSDAQLQSVPSIVLPFPAFGHTKKYETGLLKSLRAFDRMGIIHVRR